MKRIFVMGLAVLFLCLSSVAQADNKPRVLGDEDIVVSGTTVYTLTPTSGAISGLITIQGDAVRWKGHTTNPGITNGGFLYAGDYLYLGSPYQLSNFGAILSSGGSGTTIYVIYYGPSD